jgi:bifunctional non-homologous end joining protein LigD
VIIWDEGEWELIKPGDDPVAALKSGKLTFRMYGKKMFGEWALVRIGGRSKKSSDKGNEWLLLKHRDAFANPDVDVTEIAPRSVVSNKLVEEMGDDEAIWQSNRKASSRKPPTLADKLSKSSKTTKRPSKRAPSRAASARSRSSPAAAKRPVRTTARRQPR